MREDSVILFFACMQTGLLQTWKCVICSGNLFLPSSFSEPAVPPSCTDCTGRLVTYKEGRGVGSENRWV
jgi:hypothetical protein